MTLWDAQPLTPDEVRAKGVSASGHETIRRVSTSGKIRTIGHKPWWQVLGPGPAGMTCGECAFLQRRGSTARTYFKCGRQVMTRGPGTDIRKGDPACRLFTRQGGQGDGGNGGADSGQ